jgi:hypothetical protein
LIIKRFPDRGSEQITEQVLVEVPPACNPNPGRERARTLTVPLAITGPAFWVKAADLPLRFDPAATLVPAFVTRLSAV